MPFGLTLIIARKQKILKWQINFQLNRKNPFKVETKGGKISLQSKNKTQTRKVKIYSRKAAIELYRKKLSAIEMLINASESNIAHEFSMAIETRLNL